MKRLAVLMVVVFGLVACGGEKDKEEAAAEQACGPKPAATKTVHPKLPAKFPTPKGVLYTESKKTGPSTVVSGYRNGGVESAYDAYKSAFPSAGYDVTKDEREEVDAEVNFSGGGSTGQVKLLQTCRGRTNVTITIRPA